MKRCARGVTADFSPAVAFTPKGGCPLKPPKSDSNPLGDQVAFTPKGGCPLKREDAFHAPVPVVAFTPKGGCPLKLYEVVNDSIVAVVAFTPKGGCPLKPLAPARWLHAQMVG